MTDFHPALIAACKNYSAAKFRSDLVAGIVVGIVALPLAIAFAIASGVSPTVGLITAVIGGFIVSACGGNSVQIGGPTGAFIVIIYNINEAVPGDFIGKWRVYIANFNTIDISTLLIGLLSLLIIILTPKVSKRIPGALTAIVLVTVVVWVMREVFGITGIQTIGDRFGNLTPELPEAAKIGLNMESVNLLLPSAFTIAMLGAIESLLSATVADGRTGDRTNCNTELIGQGLANVVVPIFGGIPVTGAIARTMTNITNGGRTPVAGIVHAVVLLAVFMFAMPLINHVPMSCLAAVLIMVSYNMSGWRTVVGMAHDPKGDIWVLVVTFLLTVIFNLTIAIEIGLLLAVVVFLRRITENTTIKVYGEQLDAAAGTDMTQHEVLDLKPGVSVYEIDGPFFFGAATKFDEIVRHSLQENPKVRIIRMRKVPFIDSTGLHNLQLLIESSHREGIRIVLSGVRDNVRAALHNAGIDSLVGAENICDHISKAVVVANSIADGELSDKMIAL